MSHRQRSSTDGWIATAVGGSIGTPAGGSLGFFLAGHWVELHTYEGFEGLGIIIVGILGGALLGSATGAAGAAKLRGYPHPIRSGVIFSFLGACSLAAMESLGSWFRQVWPAFVAVPLIITFAVVPPALAARALSAEPSHELRDG